MSNTFLNTFMFVSITKSLTHFKIISKITEQFFNIYIYMFVCMYINIHYVWDMHNLFINIIDFYTLGSASVRWLSCSKIPKWRKLSCDAVLLHINTVSNDQGNGGVQMNSERLGNDNICANAWIIKSIRITYKCHKLIHFLRQTCFLWIAKVHKLSSI